MFPEGDRKGPCDADCTTTVGVGAGGWVTVTVTAGTESRVAVGIGFAATVGADVAVDIADLSDVAWTAVEPADDEHPATVTAPSATSHAIGRMMRCGSCGFSVMPFPCR